MSEIEGRREEQRRGQGEGRGKREWGGEETRKRRREALKAFQEGIREGGRRVEEALLNFGVKGIVLEAKVFGMVCGCAGFQTDTRGIQAEEVEVLKEDLGKLLASVGESLGIRPDFIYARKLPVLKRSSLSPSGNFATYARRSLQAQMHRHDQT